MKKQYISVALASIASIAMIAPVFAQTTNVNTSIRSRGMMRANYEDGNKGDWKRDASAPRPAVVGTVTAVSGNIITLSGQLGMRQSDTSVTKSTFTVDATNAKVLKNNATSSLSGIAVGDTIFVQGQVTGSNVVASIIHDGNSARGGYMMGERNQASAQFEGNGQPVVAGNVSAINGTTLTVTNKSNVTYTIDVSNAKVLVHNAASTVSSIAVGDMILVQGTVNGTSVTASTVIDTGVLKTITAPQMNGNNEAKAQVNRGFFGGIRGFFSHLFGF